MYISQTTVGHQQLHLGMLIYNHLLHHIFTIVGVICHGLWYQMLFFKSIKTLLSIKPEISSVNSINASDINLFALNPY